MTSNAGAAEAAGGIDVHEQARNAAAEQERLAAAAAKAAAAKAHAEAFSALEPLHQAAIAKLDELRTRLADSLERARNDPGHLEPARGFVRDVELKADEITRWIGRHLG